MKLEIRIGFPWRVVRFVCVKCLFFLFLPILISGNKTNLLKPNNLNKKLNTQASMDNKSLIDLGHFLIELRALTKSSDKKLTELIKLLNINAVKNLKTNPRLRIHIPEKNGRIVYGFNHWQQGDKTEYLENTLYEQILKNDDFMIGPQKKEWPYKIIESNNLTIFPFAPTLNIFNYYIVNSNGKRFGPSIEINRTHDIVESSADSSLTPLVYTAYTQEVGTSAERYTGMSITTPDSIPNIDYYEMEFNQLADWLSL